MIQLSKSAFLCGVFLVERKESSFMIGLILCYLFAKATLNFPEALM